MYKTLPILALSSIFLSGVNPAEKKLLLAKSNPVKEISSPADYKKDVITIYDNERQQDVNYVHDKQLYDLRCDTMPQVKFWRSIMHLTKDSALLCHSNSRCVIDKVHIKNWNTFSDIQKISYRDSLRYEYCLSDSARILLVEGKSFFYDFSKAYLNLHQGITDFIANDVDPWYAQAILLIESPNRLQKSNVGAYGPFQLMKPVARMFGLRVNRKIDERADFDHAAYAASSLMKTICIPKVKEILDTLCISYNETDLWFRLLVMHAYHAGAGNVKAVLEIMKPTEGGMQLIQSLWHTQAKGFKTASQNYSQLVLAAMLEMDEKLSLNEPTFKN